MGRAVLSLSHIHVAGGVNANVEVASVGDSLAQQNLPMGGADWVELFVREMTNASNMDDARARASRALEVLEKSICARATAEVAQTFHQVVTFLFSLIFLITLI